MAVREDYGTCSVKIDAPVATVTITPPHRLEGGTSDLHWDLGEIFSELRGETTPTGNRLVGTFLGGSGRYVGATGSYEFTWRFLIETEDGTVQGQSEGLKGRVRGGAPQGAPTAGSSR